MKQQQLACSNIHFLIRALLAALLSITLIGCQTTPVKKLASESSPPTRNLQPVSQEFKKAINNIVGPIKRANKIKRKQLVEPTLVKMHKLKNDCESTCNPNVNAMIYINLAHLYLVKKSPTEAQKFLDLALQQSPNISYKQEISTLKMATNLAYRQADYTNADRYLNQLAGLPTYYLEGACYFGAENALHNSRYKIGLKRINTCINKLENEKRHRYAMPKAYRVKLKLIDALGLNEERESVQAKLEKAIETQNNYSVLFKLKATYPKAQLQQKIEGYCTVEYNILATGRTANVNIVDCPNSAFEEVSINAAKLFLYKPKFEAGKPVAVNGVRNKIHFEMRKK